jgi:hypothetical protein
MMANNMGVYDLDTVGPDGLPDLNRIFSGTPDEIEKLLTEKANPNFMGDIDALGKAGFKIANSAALNEKLNSDRPYDMYSPDAVMVNTGSEDGSPLKNAIVYLYAKGDQNTLHIHLAVDSATPVNKLNDISDNMIQKAPGEPFSGYMSLNRARNAEGSLAEGNGLTGALKAFDARNLKTVKFPFDNYGLGFMPFFGEDGNITARKNDVEIAQKLVENFREFNQVVDIPERALNQALKTHPDMHHLAVDIDEPEREREINHSRRPSM